MVLDSKSSTIFTNPEMLVDARKDEYFREVLNTGDLNILAGPVWARRSLSSRNPPAGGEAGSKPQMSRLTGIDFMLTFVVCQEK